MRVRQCRPSDPPAPVAVVQLSWPLPRASANCSVWRRGVPRSLLIRPLASARQTRAARVQPVRDGFINSMQVYPWTQGRFIKSIPPSGGSLDIAAPAGEQLVERRPVAAGDTVRWIIGDTESGSGATRRIHILVKSYVQNLKRQAN